jgi:L-asparaginase II
MIAPKPWPFEPWVRVDRGGRPEAILQGALVVVDDRGRELARSGDPSWGTYLRSSVKMIQALPLVRSGAADRFGLTPRHLAVCCASHHGEPMHVAAVREVLAACGRDESVLHCGPHPPFHAASAAELVRRGEPYRPIHSDCSGKHSGMITTCVHRGWPVETYWEGDHPIQREIRATLAALAGIDEPPFAIDGCGVPTFFLALESFALAVARFAAGAGPAEKDAAHTARLFDAMRTHPEMVAGTDGFCTELMRAANRPLIAKGGAEGLYVAAWREDDGRGVALVAKAAAGDARCRSFSVTEALSQLGLLDEAGLARLAPFHRGPVRNWAGTEVGELVSLLALEGPGR